MASAIASCRTSYGTSFCHSIGSPGGIDLSLFITNGLSAFNVRSPLTPLSLRVATALLKKNLDAPIHLLNNFVCSAFG